MRVLSIPYYIRRCFYGFVLRLLCGKCGARPLADSPLEWFGLKRMSFGDHVDIGYKSWLSVLPPTEDRPAPALVIGDGTRLGNFNHIIAAGKITIGKDVLTADHVYIADNTHDYSDPDTPVIRQKILSLKETSVGDGCWLGENVCVFGARIGKHCVIGANSVVNHDIPDYCVAAGSPARIIRRYDLETKQWIRVQA